MANGLWRLVRIRDALGSLMLYPAPCDLGNGEKGKNVSVLTPLPQVAPSLLTFGDVFVKGTALSRQWLLALHEIQQRAQANRRVAVVANPAQLKRDEIRRSAKVGAHRSN